MYIFDRKQKYKMKKYIPFLYIKRKYNPNYHRRHLHSINIYVCVCMCVCVKKN